MSKDIVKNRKGKVELNTNLVEGKDRAVVVGNSFPVEHKTKLSKGIGRNELTGKVYLSKTMGTGLKGVSLKILKLAKGLKEEEFSPKQVEQIKVAAMGFSPKDIAITLNEMEVALKGDPSSEQLRKYKDALMYFTLLMNDSSKVAKEGELLKVDIDLELEKFIRNCSKSGSKRTQNDYRKQITNLIQWAKDNYNLSLQYLDRDHAIAYKDYLVRKTVKNGETKLANHSVNTYLTGIMAFYKHLHKVHPVVDRIFLEINRPIPQNSKPINIPTTKDAKAIMKYLKDIDSVLAFKVELALRTGFRVGAFNTLSFDNKGNFIIEWTKGKRFTGNFNKYDYSGNKPLYKGIWKYSIMELIHREFGDFKGRISPFSECKAHNLSQGLINHSKTLFDNGVIEFRYSFHDLRHYFANKYYVVSGHDIVLLKGLLNHQLLNTTFKYLDTIGFNSPRNHWN